MAKRSTDTATPKQWTGGPSLANPCGNVARQTGLLTALTAAIALAGCAPTVTRHGHHFQDNDVQQVQTGMSGQQVMGLLGSPTTTATASGAQTFYYISSTETQTAFFKSQETDRKVLAIYFSPLGAVERTAQYGLKDGKIINFSTNKTADSSKDEGILKQLFKKLGTKQLFGEQ